MVTGIKMRMPCPDCGMLHIDEVDNKGVDWSEKEHHTHACQYCGNVWRPAIENTFGVRFLPGFHNIIQTKNEGTE